ncbi:alpha/beta hydrolase [Haloplanus rubicundus]|uniref:alpha/beta hydrolase n=1 Tax=Haloplanus rubicundus TaxID=1547898 RepID=UPI001CA3F36B|nr:dienelactone hydrolase family protein [Haloplanus rubicundus]
MPTERLALPGGRDVRASLDADGPADAAVVACPPHPQHGGTRHDGRLTAVSDALPAHVDCLRFDYGPWNEGRGERTDAENACAWATERYDRVACFGYSFGGGIALLTAAGTPVDAVAALSPVAHLDDGTDVAAAVGSIDAPLWVGYGTRDTTVDAERVAAAARDHGATVETFAADHFFVGQEATVAERVAAFVEGVL